MEKTEKGLELKLRENRMYTNQHSGQSFTEYSLLMGILILIAMTTLPVLQSNLSSSMQTMIPKRQPLQNANLAITALNVEHLVAPIDLKDLAFTTANGTPVSLKDVPTDLSKSILTLGANGATKLLSDRIRSIANQLKAAGEITEVQYNALVSLSNQGHEIATVEKMITDAVKNTAGDSARFNSMNFVYNGQTYTGNELRALTGVPDENPSTLSKSDILKVTNQNELSGNFQSLYQQALAKGALNDPLTLSIVNNAATQILQIGELFEDTMVNFIGGKAQFNDEQSLNIVVSSKATDIHAAVICQAGNSTDNGAFCH